jgi:hypothetical protein
MSENSDPIKSHRNVRITNIMPKSLLLSRMEHLHGMDALRVFSFVYFVGFVVLIFASHAIRSR